MSLTYRRLTEFNVAGRELREKRRLLVYGSCIFNEYPDILSRFSEGHVALGVCLEAEHLNVVALKLASIFARVDLEEVVVLTVDGSPHCIQLHHAVEEARKVTGRQVNVRHFVIKGGEALEVSPEAVKVARFLSKIQRLLSKT
jgi:hypothetical protein